MKHEISKGIFIDDTLSFEKQDDNAIMFIEKSLYNRILTTVKKGSIGRPIEKTLDFGKEIYFIEKRKYQRKNENAISSRTVLIIKR